MMSPDALTPLPPPSLAPTPPFPSTPATTDAEAAVDSTGNSHRVANAVVHVQPLGSSGLGEQSPGKWVDKRERECVIVWECVRGWMDGWMGG